MTDSDDLESLITYDIPDEGAWFDHPYTPFRVKLGLATPDLISGLVRSSTKKVKNAETKWRIEERYDPDLFQSSFAKAVIKDWQGLGKEVLRQLFPTADISANVPQSGIQPTDNNKVWLMKKCNDFSNWVTGICMEIESFKKEQKQQDLDNLKV